LLTDENKIFDAAFYSTYKLIGKSLSNSGSTIKSLNLYSGSFIIKSIKDFVGLRKEKYL